MILGFLKGNRISNLLFLPLIAILLWLQEFMNPEIKLFAIDQSPMPLYGLVLPLAQKFYLVSKIIGLLIFLVLVSWVTILNKRFSIIETRSYMIGFFFVLLGGVFLPMQRLHPGLIGALFLLLSLEKIFQSYHKDQLDTGFFDAGLFIGIGSLFYFSLVYFMFLIWIGIMILRAPRIREFIMVPLGVILPFVFAWAYYFFTNQTTIFFEILKENFFLLNYLSYLNVANYLIFFFILILVLISSAHIVRDMSSKKISARKYLRLMFWLFIISLALLLFISSASLELLPVIAIPLSFLFANYFRFVKNQLIGNVLLTVFMLLLVGVQLYPYLIIWLQ